MFGAVLAAVLAVREAKFRKLDGEIIWDVMPWLLIAGILGGSHLAYFYPTGINAGEWAESLFYPSPHYV